MPYCWALLLVTLQTLRRARVRARSKAKRMMRSQPTSVKMADLIGYAGPADRAEVDGVEVLEDLEAVGGHHPAGARGVLAAPVELLPVERERPGAADGQRVEHLPPGGNHLLADAVRGNRRDPERAGRTHHVSPSCRACCPTADS